MAKAKGSEAAGKQGESAEADAMQVATATESAVSPPKDDPVLEGRYLGSHPSLSQPVHIKCEDESRAIQLLCQYLRCKPQEAVVAKAKKSSGPKKGDLVLRPGPIPGVKNGDPLAGYAYGAEG